MPALSNGLLARSRPSAATPALALALVIAAIVVVPGCGGGGGGGGSVDSASKPRLAFVTNGVASFWVIAEKGARDAAAEFNADVQVVMPNGTAADQKAKVQDLLTRGVQGFAITAIDPANQADLFDEVAANAKFITHDSDAPESKRLCYVGMDNYTAGRMCGKLVKDALPDGGSVMLFVGFLDQLNARLRRQGVIDELLDRDPDSSRFDAPGSPLKGERYTILDTRTDNFDFSKAKAEAQDAITKHPDLAAMVGLFAYNPPLILEAVREAGKLGTIRIIGFDEDDQTLAAIADGHIYGTVVQNPYRYGYESIRILAELVRGNDSVLPEGGYLDIPARSITKENVAEFRAELDSLLGK